MKILGLDTAMGACSAAILDGEKVLACHYEALSRGHAEKIVDIVSALSAQSGVALTDLDRIAVTIGPGTFTGQRVGLSAARGMILGTPVELVGVTTLEAVAAGVEEVEKGDLIASVFDARRGEVYLQLFDGHQNALTDPLILSPKDAIKELTSLVAKQELILVGTGAGLVSDGLQQAGIRLKPSKAKSQPDAVHVAKCGRGKPTPDTVPLPLYLRAPDAKLPGGVEGPNNTCQGHDFLLIARRHMIGESF